MSDLPPVTHLQFVILESLIDGERAGREVRKELAGHGAKRTLPAFYELMGRLERGGLVTGDYSPKTVNGQTVRERRYALTDEGREAWAATCRFYREKIAARVQEA